MCLLEHRSPNRAAQEHDDGLDRGQRQVKWMPTEETAQPCSCTDRVQQAAQGSVPEQAMPKQVLAHTAAPGTLLPLPLLLLFIIRPTRFNISPRSCEQCNRDDVSVRETAKSADEKKRICLSSAASSSSVRYRLRRHCPRHSEPIHTVSSISSLSRSFCVYSRVYGFCSESSSLWQNQLS